MRTTLTLDDSLVSSLKRKAAERNLPFKTVVNQALRFGLEAMEGTSVSGQVQRTKTRSMGLKPGYDPDKIGQTSDEMEDEQLLQKDA